MQLFKVPKPPFPSIRDITLYTLSNSREGPAMINSNLRGSSLKGQRSIADFFHILDHFIVLVNGDDYKLQLLDDKHRPLAGPPAELSAVEGGIAFKPILTFFNFPFERTDSPPKPGAKRAKRDGEWTTASEKSSRDPSDDSQGFKMRLVYRDTGCAVCLAAGIQAIYEGGEDSNRYEGSHIIDFAHHELWDTRGLAALVSDPFTDPANANNQFASPSTRTKEDLRRIDSLENGMLLCLQHHGDFHNFRFAINPDTHEIFFFHPAIAKLQGVEVKAPWDHRDVLFPPPHPTFLELHYFTSISKAMEGSEGDCELDDDDENYEEFSEPEEVQNEQVKIWLDGLSSDREVTSSLDFTADCSE